MLETKGIDRDDTIVAGERTPKLAVELPAADDLPDTALRDEAFWHVGMRSNF